MGWKEGTGHSDPDVTSLSTGGRGQGARAGTPVPSTFSPPPHSLVVRRADGGPSQEHNVLNVPGRGPSRFFCLLFSFYDRNPSYTHSVNVQIEAYQQCWHFLSVTHGHTLCSLRTDRSLTNCILFFSPGHGRPRQHPLWAWSASCPWGPGSPEGRSARRERSRVCPGGRVSVDGLSDGAWDFWRNRQDGASEERCCMGRDGWRENYFSFPSNCFDMSGN